MTGKTTNGYDSGTYDLWMLCRCGHGFFATPKDNQSRVGQMCCNCRGDRALKQAEPLGVPVNIRDDRLLVGRK